MKAILMSIQPKWCKLIAHGNKTIEVRKTKPKLEPPFKVYMYCTKNGGTLYYLGKTDNMFDTPKQWNGKVIGEFACDKIINYDVSVIACAKWEVNGADVQEELRYNAGDCLTAEEMFEYSKGKPLYGFHISQLKLYDEPKELGEFKKGCNDMFDPQFGSYCVYCEEKCNIKRQPQSWCYVEEQHNDKK